MSFGIFGIVGAEFLPASLLTPIANGLDISEGMAGQAVTVTAGMGVIASLLVTVVSGRIDRRNVLMFFTLLLVASNLLVASASDLMALLLARMLLGIALGGFWALSPAVILRLVPENDVPKALAILFAGVSAATVFAAPFGTFLGDLFGWRNVFYVAAGVGVAAGVVQFLALPSMPSSGSANLGTIVLLLSRSNVALGMFSLLLVFIGHFVFFTYLRPFLEDVTKMDPIGVTLILLIFGVGTFLGNSLSSWLIKRSMLATLLAMPLALCFLGLLLSVLGGNAIGDAALIAAWGIVFGVVPVSWSTWVTRAVPDEAESGGGLLVATCNLAIAIGSAGGGLIFDEHGSEGILVTSAAVLALGVISASNLNAVR
ncbi:MFS transporter [Microbulbifer taiwanensis]|uniref:MFS transporter n=2 Tax=Microbulbifer taiwanensis TaxID=986746 RepID=A0ABW1YKG0_9GAMM